MYLFLRNQPELRNHSFAAAQPLLRDVIVCFLLSPQLFSIRTMASLTASISTLLLCKVEILYEHFQVQHDIDAHRERFAVPNECNATFVIDVIPVMKLRPSGSSTIMLWARGRRQ